MAWGLDKLRTMLAEKEALANALDATDQSAGPDRESVNIRMEPSRSRPK